MSRKLSSNWDIALVYYITSNLITFVPLVIIALLIGRVVTQLWQYIVLYMALSAPVMVGSLKYSAHNVNKNYVITEKRPVLQLTMIYLWVFNISSALILLLYTGYISPQILVMFLVTTEIAVIYLIFNPKFIQETPIEERKTVTAQFSIIKTIVKTAVLMISGIILLLFVPVVMYAWLSITELSSKIIWGIIGIYLTVVIFLAYKFIFKNT